MRAMNTTKNITATLNELEFLMATVHPPAFMALGDGLALHEIERKVHAYSHVLEQAGVTFPFELVELYHWHDGSNKEDIIGIVQLLSLDEALKTWGMLIDAAGNQFPSKDWYNPKWIPFATSWADTYLCIDLHGSGGGTPGQIIQFARNSPTRIIDAFSMKEWLEEVVDDYELEEPTRTHGIAAGDEGEDELYDYDPEEAPDGPSCYIGTFEAGDSKFS